MWQSTFRLEYRIPRFRLQRRWLLKRGPGLTDMGAEPVAAGTATDGVVGCVYESFVPGDWHRWMEKEILWFCFRRAEPERMISGWTASSRDSSKTEEGKAPGVTDKFAPNSE